MGRRVKDGAKRFAGFPDEITVEIFLRLPTKALVRFRCVSRLWKSLISSPAFVRAHLDRSSEFRSFDLVKFNDEDKSRLGIRAVGSDRISSLDIGPWLGQQPQRFNLVDSCNGVLCLSTYEKDGPSDPRIILCNPSIKEYKFLPQPLAGVSEFIGFGSDTSTGYLDDFKVINVNLTFGEYPDVSSEVEVYSARTNSWKQLGNVFPLRLTMNLGKQVMLEKYICWCPYARLKCQIFKSLLLLYDAVSESFSQMALPSTMPPEKKHITLLDGCLSLITRSSPLEQFEVWIMKDFGDVKSWTKLYSMEPFGKDIDRYWPLGFASSGDVFFVRGSCRDQRADSSKNLVTYDVMNDTFEDLEVKVDSFYSSQLFRYAESLNFPSAL